MIKAKKSLGQNFLVDENVSRRIVESVSPGQSDIVIEIGPGKGALTHALLKRSGLVVAIELDARLIEHLKNQIQLPNFALIEADALSVNWADIVNDSAIRWKALYPNAETTPRARVVANLPYYVATPIVEKLLRLRDRFSDLTLMLQEEVVDRMVSEPGGKDYGYLSLFVQYHATTDKLFRVPPMAFSPVPKVYSAMIHLTMRDRAAVEVADEGRFFALIRAAFAQRRKTILNNLKAAATILPYAVAPDAALERAWIDAKRRAETLSIEEFAALDAALFES